MELRFDDSWRDYLILVLMKTLFMITLSNRYTLASFREKFRNHNILIFRLILSGTILNRRMPPVRRSRVFNGHPRQANYNEKAFAYGIENGLYLSAGTDAHRRKCRPGAF